jgi:hypothetical protein
VRFQPSRRAADELASLDEWIAKQDNKASRPEAIRPLLDYAIDGAAQTETPNQTEKRS